MVTLPPASACPDAMVCTPRPPGFETHDGFFFTVSLGMSGNQQNSHSGGVNQAISGVGATFGTAAGWAVAADLIVHVAYTIAGPGKPALVTDGVRSPVRSSDAWGYGPGVTYYFPHNFYVSGTGLIARLSVESIDGRTSRTARGPGFELVAGKEWWTSANWGIGAAAKLLHASLAGGDLGPGSWQTTSGALVMCATFN